MITKNLASKMVLLCLCVLGTIGISSIKAEARSLAVEDVCVSTSLNVRSGPGTGYSIISTQRRGADLVGGDVQGQQWQGDYLWRNYYYPAASAGSYQTGINGWVAVYVNNVGSYVQNASLMYRANTSIYSYYDEGLYQPDYSKYYPSGSSIQAGFVYGYSCPVYSPSNINAWKTANGEWVNGWNVNAGPNY